MPKAPALSESVTVMNTVPARGSGAPAAACALANAVGKSRAMPITSPVERISGPSSESAPSKRSNGSTASLTRHVIAVAQPLALAGQAQVGDALAEHDRGRRAWPAAGRSPWRRTAPCARRAGWPRSRTARRSCDRRTARSAARRRRAPSAISRVAARICSSMSSPSECGGSTQALSPECTPASSTCCMIPPIQTSCAVAEGVDVDLDRVLQEAVQDRWGALRARAGSRRARPAS